MYEDDVPETLLVEQTPEFVIQAWVVKFWCITPDF